MAVDVGENTTLENLKAFLVRNLPVLIPTSALTPFAHPVGFFPDTFGLINFPASGPYSSLLGRMASLETLKENEVSGFTWAKEAYFVASRVVIGYDEEFREMILHCPTLGPAWRVSYEQFDQMWQAGGASYFVMKPPDFERCLSVKQVTEGYPERTADQRAAQHLIYGIARSAADSRGGHAWGAIEELRQGVELSGVSKGYRHLLLLELAHHGLRGDPAEALRSAREAVRLFKWNWEGWRLLELLHRRKGNIVRARICMWVSSLLYTLLKGVELPILPRDFTKGPQGQIFGLE